MSDLEKIQFLLEFLRTEKFDNIDLTRASSLVSSYKWLMDQFEKEKVKGKES